MHGHETDRREVMSPRQASAVLEDIALEPQPYGMRAEAIGYAQREGETLETGVLLGGDRLRRHSGPPAHADGWVSVQVGLTDGTEGWPASGHYDARRLRRGLEEGVPPRSLEEHEREWQKGTNPKGHDEPGKHCRGRHRRAGAGTESRAGGRNTERAGDLRARRGGSCVPSRHAQ